MKVLYRSSGSSLPLDEAMTRVREFSSVEEMLDYLVKAHSLEEDKAFNKSQIFISYYGEDTRIDWTTFIITVSRYFDKDYMKEFGHPQAIGFCTFKE